MICRKDTTKSKMREILGVKVRKGLNEGDLTGRGYLEVQEASSGYLEVQVASSEYLEVQELGKNSYDKSFPVHSFHRYPYPGPFAIETWYP